MTDNFEKLGNLISGVAGVQDTDSGKLGYHYRGSWRVVDPDDPKRFLVRFSNGTHVSAFHQNRVPQKYDLNVLVGKDHLGRPVILGEDRSSNQNFHSEGSAGTNVGVHYHLRGGGMEFIVDEWMLKHLRVTPNVSSLTVSITQGSYLYDRELRWKASGSLDLSSYLPTILGLVRWVIVGINPVNDSFVLSAGNQFTLVGNTPDLEALELITFVENGYIPLAAIWLAYGDTGIPPYRVQDLRHAVSNIYWYLGDLLNVSGDSDYDGYVLTFNDGYWMGEPTSVLYSDYILSNPPLSSEIDQTFGSQRNGFLGLIEDGSSNLWLIARKSDKWWYIQMNEAL
jgi:hypothetical protein